MATANKPGIKPENRNPSGKGGFKKGKSGNPSGRPKGSKGFAAYIRERTHEGKLIVDFWMNLMQAKGEFKDADVRERALAAKELSDRGIGKPGEYHELLIPEAGGAAATEDKKGGYVFTIKVSGGEAP